MTFAPALTCLAAALLEGEGIIAASGATDPNGTSRGVIEKITSLGRKVVLEDIFNWKVDE